MSGIADVARLAGVSKSTASRAMSGSGYVSAETRRRVTSAASAVGYVPSASAVSLASGRTNTIGVLLPGVTRWFFAEVLEGIQAALLDAGLDLALYDAKAASPGRRRILDDFIARRRFDGLIAVGVDPDDDELERIDAIDRPVVGVASGGFADDIGIDDVDVGRRATEHLLGLGHRRILFLGGGGAQPGTRVQRRRFDGYRAAMAAAGLGSRITHVPCEVSLPGGYAAAADILGDLRARPTGIVGVDDEVAIGAIIAARRLGIGVPHELSVVGVDDHAYADMFSLTTLAQDARAQGALAVDLLRRRIASPTGLVVPVPAPQARLVMRNSTAVPTG
jgi:DNA-binding LacI/PurR family transcriptional regulator